MKTQYYFLASILLLIPACGGKTKKAQSRPTKEVMMFEPEMEKEYLPSKELGLDKEELDIKEIGIDNDSDESIVIMNEDSNDNEDDAVIYELSTLEIEDSENS